MQRVWQLALGGLIGTLMVAVGVAAAFFWFQPSGVAGTHDDIASSSEYEGTKLDGPAPDFRLVDQNGASVSLSDFRGMAVVLSLLDPDCTDICPIYAYHFRLTYQALGEDAERVAFLAFNANDEKNSVADVMAATKKWGTDEIPTRHYLTGSPDELKAVWNAYGIQGSGPPKIDKPSELQHSPAIFVIDQAGQLRWYFSTVYEGAPPPSALMVKHVRTLLGENR